MNKIRRLKHEIAILKSKEAEDKDPKIKKGWKMPFKIRSMAKKADKTDDTILVLYLSQKYQAKWKLCKIVSGNLIVFQNKVHVLNPKAIWRHGKYIFYIIREIDRMPVSNLDYNKVKARGDDTAEDVPLIKAVIGAQLKKPAMEGKSKWVVIAVIIVIALVVGFIIFGGGGG